LELREDSAGFAMGTTRHTKKILFAKSKLQTTIISSAASAAIIGTLEKF
jgi:hypothetical protein